MTENRKEINIKEHFLNSKNIYKTIAGFKPESLERITSALDMYMSWEVGTAEGSKEDFEKLYDCIVALDVVIQANIEINEMKEE